MKNIAGSPVEGDDFFGRELAIDHFQQQLKDCDILLLGPRRIGKTSIARAVMAALRDQGWQTVEINVASCISEQDFLKKLESILSPELSSLPQKVKKTFEKKLSEINSRIRSVKIGGVGISLEEKESEDWTQVACDVLQLIAEAKQNWLIYMDELPIMLYNMINNDPQNGVQRVRRFLDWFRNDVRALPSSDNIRWLISGSVGLDTLVQEHGMADTINSLSHEGLEPFTNEVAFEMLGKLADSYEILFTDEDKKKMIAAVQWPQSYYIQLAFNHLRTLRSSNPTSNISDLIHQALDKMIQPGADNDFHHWEIRLNLQLSSINAAHALALLNHSAHSPSGVRPETLLTMLQERMNNNSAEEARHTFIRLRDILLRDAYWQINETANEKRYQFRLEPLRLWWLRRNTL